MTEPTMSVPGRRVSLCALCALILAFAATAQEVEPPPIGPDHGRSGESGESGQPDLQSEMREIFRRVETKLRDIDVLLSDASVGDTSRLDEAEAAGLDELLRESVEAGRSVQSEIDQLLRLAAQAGGQSGASGAQSSQQNGKQGEQQGQNDPSPLDGQGGRPSGRGQEATPTLPEQVRPEQQGEQPGAEKDGEQPGGEEPDRPGDGEKPEDGAAQPDDDARNRENADPEAGETDAPAGRADLSERWGELPIHVRDVFRTEGGEDLPAEYRDWIDAYYRKLNERAARGR